MRVTIAKSRSGSYGSFGYIAGAMALDAMLQ
jgi:hypothetical protein